MVERAPSNAGAEWPEVALHASPYRTLGVVAVSLVFVLMGIATLLGYPNPLRPWSAKWIASGLGIPFFGFVGLLALRQGLTRGALVRIGPRGVRDVRPSPEWIPWSAITGYSQGNNALRLTIDTAVEASIPPTRLSLWTKAVRALMGPRGYSILHVAPQGRSECA